MTSMGNDLLRGNRLELPWFAGKVAELGRKHGIPTPTNDFVYAALKLYADGPPGWQRDLKPQSRRGAGAHSRSDGRVRA